MSYVPKSMLKYHFGWNIRSMAPQIVGHQWPRILESKGCGGVIISAPQADLGNPTSPILHLEISSGCESAEFY